METPKPNSMLRFFPSLTDAAFLMPLVFLFGRMQGTSSLLSDGDTGWHIRTGEWILQHGQVPHQDIFSFTKPGAPWFAWEWLWDVMAAWLYRNWGMAAVLLGSVLVLCLAYGLLFRLVLRKCPNAVIAIGVTFIAEMGGTMHWLARPHLVTFVFLVGVLWVLESAREGRRRWLWVLPPAMVLWTNLHGGFAAGLILIGAYGAGEAITAAVAARAEQRQAALREARAYLLAWVGCALATLVNPYFYRLHVHLWQYLREPRVLDLVSEWQSISFHNPAALFFEIMLALGVMAALWNLYRRQFAYALLLLGWMHQALIYSRNIPVFLIVAAPLVAEALQEAISAAPRMDVAGWLKAAARRFDQAAVDFGTMDRIPRFHLISGAAVLLLALLLYSPVAPAKFRAEYDGKNYPAKAVQVLRAGPATDRVFTHDDWGDYLIYSLAPKEKVFIDGRFDFYGPKLIQDYLDIIELKQHWQDRLQQFRINTVLMPVECPLTNALKESRNWHPVYDDGMAIIFRAADTRAPAQVAQAPTPSRISVAAQPEPGCHASGIMTTPQKATPVRLAHRGRS